jgi:hypothetical protein
MTRPKRDFAEVEKELRNQLGIWDMSQLSDISKNATAWVGVNSDGQKVIYRCPAFLMAYAVHAIGRHFASKAMDYSRPGRHEVKVTFDIYRHDDPTYEIKGITVTIPYEIQVSFKHQNERVTSKEARDRINQFQEKNNCKPCS